VSPAGQTQRLETLLQIAPLFLDEADDLVAELSEPYYRGTARFLCQRFRVLHSLALDLNLGNVARATRATEVFYELMWLGTIDIDASHWPLLNQLSVLYAALFEKLRMVRSDVACGLESQLIEQHIGEAEPLVRGLLGPREEDTRIEYEQITID
jgi:hypothetical protein